MSQEKNKEGGETFNEGKDGKEITNKCFFNVIINFFFFKNKNELS